jgi:hypothetical protein
VQVDHALQHELHQLCAAAGSARDLDNAVMEGADVLESGAVPIGLSTLYTRIDEALRSRAAYPRG